ncbi:hypothetical protein LWI29_020376 [Acer saccharum]|uniref:Uncharacterized protein n=1 Tax=Acer saccharum TaxID=4024 RepID=A0AA39SD14_ACESA|nr:hypothetical protein LWI29_020376 [Acer saccharum]
MARIEVIEKEKESSMHKIKKSSEEVDELKDDFAQRMRLMKAEIEQKDRALEIMKNKELENITKLVKAEQEIKSLIADVMKQHAEVKINKTLVDAGLVVKDPAITTFVPDTPMILGTWNNLASARGLPMISECPVRKRRQAGPRDDLEINMDDMIDLDQ